MKYSIRALIGVSLLMAGTLAFSGEQSNSTALAEDTPATTVAGNTFTAPAGWYLSVRGPASIVEAPEGGSQIVIVDVEAEDADAALAAAWAAYKEPKWELETSDDRPDDQGFSGRRGYVYRTSPNERRGVIARAGFANGVWTVWIYDMANEIGGKRGAQVNLLLSSLLPKGYTRETFAGKKAHKLDNDRVAALTAFVQNAVDITGVPGVGLGIVQDGEVVFAGGFGVRELGKPEKVDAETSFIVASNTKAMATLLLAKLVDAGEMTWKTPVTDLLPSFKLGDEDTTSRTLVEHLICACTGLPRKDLPWIFEFGGLTADESFSFLAEIQPTSDFGEMFQYSNSLAAAAGYVGGHVMHPEHDFGTAFDKAMQSEVFDPLGMDSTTFDFETAMSGNFASAHSTTIDGEPSFVPMSFNYAVIHVRPAGGAWSNVNDMLKYIQMELDDGVLPNGDRYISSENLLERRAPRVALSENHHYGMGLMVDNNYDVSVVHHGGDMMGHHSDMMWLPEHNVGAIVLTSGDPGWLIRGEFRRRLLEVLFDGKPEAEQNLAAGNDRYIESFAVGRSQYDSPPNPDVAAKLAERYHSDSLGDIIVSQEGESIEFDFGEWKSEVTTKENPDGTVSIVSISPGLVGFEFVVGDGDRPTLIARDAQHEYEFQSL